MRDDVTIIEFNDLPYWAQEVMTVCRPKVVDDSRKIVLVNPKCDGSYYITVPGEVWEIIEYAYAGSTRKVWEIREGLRMPLRIWERSIIEYVKCAIARSGK